MQDVLEFILDLFKQIVDLMDKYQINDFETAITMIKTGELSGIIVGILAIIKIIIDKIT